MLYFIPMQRKHSPSSQSETGFKYFRPWETTVKDISNMSFGSRRNNVQHMSSTAPEGSSLVIFHGRQPVTSNRSSTPGIPCSSQFHSSFSHNDSGYSTPSPPHDKTTASRKRKTLMSDPSATNAKRPCIIDDVSVTYTSVSHCASFLEKWVVDNNGEFYPSQEDRHWLCMKTGLNKSQIRNWFSAKRSRTFGAKARRL